MAEDQAEQIKFLCNILVSIFSINHQAARDTMIIYIKPSFLLFGVYSIVIVSTVFYNFVHYHNIHFILDATITTYTDDIGIYSTIFAIASKQILQFLLFPILLYYYKNFMHKVFHFQQYHMFDLIQTLCVCMTRRDINRYV